MAGTVEPAPEPRPSELALLLAEFAYAIPDVADELGLRTDPAAGKRGAIRSVLGAIGVCALVLLLCWLATP